MTEPLTIPTEKDSVYLRELATLSDDQAYFDAVEASRPELSRFGGSTSTKYPTVEAVTASRLDPDNQDRLRMGIWDEDLFVGTINEDAGEIGYWLDSRMTGRGYATVAAKALAAYMGRAHAWVHTGNDQSAAVLERAGFRHSASAAGHLIFEYGGIDQLLIGSESVSLQDRPEPGTQRWAYGYNFGEINNNTRTEGDSVVLTVEPEGAIEPVIITGDITLTVKALKGTGLLVRWNDNDPTAVDILPVGVGHQPITLVQGDAYYYLNTYADSELIIRDDCTPAFKQCDEVQLTVAPELSDTPDGRTLQLPPAFWQGFQLNAIKYNNP